MSARQKPVELTPRLLTAADAASYLSLPLSSFQRLGIGRVQLGARVRYDRMALDDWLDEQRGRAPVSMHTQSEDDADAALARFSHGLQRASRRS